jgi:hypothetical protein
MTKINLTNLSSLTNETAALNNLNSNWAVISTAIDNTLSRDGTSPNQMGADFDMNSHKILNIGDPLDFHLTNRIINLPDAIDLQSPVTLHQLSTVLTSLTGALAGHPATSTDKAAARYSGTLGVLQNSGLIISDGNGITADVSNAGVPSFDIYTTDGVHQADISTTSYGPSGGGIFHGKHARGTRTSPTASQAGDIIGGYGFRAFHSGGAFQLSSPASWHGVASENQTATNFGMYHRFLTTPKGSTTRQERVIIADTGTLWAHDTSTFDPTVTLQTQPFGSAVNAQILSSGSSNACLGAVSYGGNVGGGFRGGNARGTPANPTATLSGDLLTFLGAHGYDGNGSFAGSKALISLRAAEDFSTTNQGTEIGFAVTTPTTTTRTEYVTLSSGVLKPGSNGLTALGTGTNSWSNLFLASGGVLNFNNGNLTLTHSAGLITNSGAWTNSGAVDLQQNISFSGDISPTSLSADQNDYNPTNLATASTIRQTSSANVNITGLAGGADGRIIILHNIGATFSLTLKNESVSSTAANRFNLSADVTVGPSVVVMLQYDSTSSRWRVIGGTGGGSGAPTTSAYVTIGSDATLTAERALTAGSGITITDGGANSTVTVAVNAGTVLQVLQTTYVTNANLTTVIPADDTIPQSTEGTQVLSQAIIPASSSNKILCIYSGWGEGDGTSTSFASASLFRGTTCINASTVHEVASGQAAVHSITHLDSPATTSSTTYSVRVGPDAGTVRLNGLFNARLFGGASACTLTLMEIKG